MKKRWILLLILSIFYIALKASLSDFSATMLMKDSYGYMAYPSWRPITIPFIFHFFHSPHAIVWFQWGFSAFAWLALAWSLCWIMKPYWLAVVSAIITLLFSLSHSILQWDFAVLSESLSFSFLALLIASFFVLYKLYMSGNPVPTLVFLIVIVVPVLFLFINTRDANAYILVLVVPVFLFVFYYKKHLQMYLVISVIFIVASAGIYLYQSHSATNNARWEMPLTHVIFSRVLTDPEAKAYFVHHGMPMSKDLMTVAGQPKAKVPNSIKKEFESWLAKDGKNVYVKYMITHPVKTFHDFLLQLPSAFNYPVIVKYYGQVHLGGLSHQFNKYFFNRTFHPFRWILILTIVPLGLIFINRRYWRVHVLSLTATAAFVSQAYIGYMGDAIEGVRHSLMGDALFRLSICTMLLSIFYGIYSYWTRNVRKAR